MKRIALIAAGFAMIACGQALAQSITVTKPAANDTWYKGSPYTITWTKQGQTGPTVTIQLRDVADTTPVLTIANNVLNNGSYQWPSIPATVTPSTYRVKLVALGVTGIILGAAYLLWLYQRVFFGTVTNPKNEKLHDLTPREVLTFAPLVIMAFWIGLYPKPFFEILEQPVNQIVHTVRPNYPGLNGVVNASTQPTMPATEPEALIRAVPPAANAKGKK